MSVAPVKALPRDEAQGPVLSTDGGDGPVVLEAKHVSKGFHVPGSARGRSRLHALTDVSITLRTGEITALIGESGSGKSTLARVLAQLDREDDGEVELRGERVRTKGRQQFRRYVSDVQMVFQDPFSSLNPMKSVRDHIARPMRIHGRATSSGDAAAKAEDLLREVQLTPTADVAAKFPHELSGGQRQRVAIARALAVQPAVLLADEPVSMLDVSMRLGVLNLLQQIVLERSVALLYLTHDIASARYFAKRGSVMYAGEVVEEGTCEEITQAPAHPYTQLLIASAPKVGQDTPAPIERGSTEPPNLIELPRGCRFAARCPFAMQRCLDEHPPLIPLAEGRSARCWLHDEDTVKTQSPISADHAAPEADGLPDSAPSTATERPRKEKTPWLDE